MPRASILDAWLAKVGQAMSPVQSPQAADPFRDPISQAFLQAFPILLDCVLGRAPFVAAAEPLAHLIRIRAVQDLTPAQAVSFLFDLKPLVDPAAHEGIDRLALAAFDQYMLCREELYTARYRELRRRTRVIERRLA